MIDYTARDITMPTPASLQLPLQAAPVDRMSSSGALGDGSGVEAAGVLDDIMKGVQTVAGVAGPILGSLGSLGI
jgi:hypothetical protein